MSPVPVGFLDAYPFFKTQLSLTKSFKIFSSLFPFLNSHIGMVFVLKFTDTVFMCLPRITVFSSGTGLKEKSMPPFSGFKIHSTRLSCFCFLTVSAQ